jgi:hypothetical protein
VGWLIEVRIIGVFETTKSEGKTESNDRLLGVAIHSCDHQGLQTIQDVTSPLLSKLEAFYISCNRQRLKIQSDRDRRAEEGDRFLKAGTRAHRKARSRQPLLRAWLTEV